MLIQAPNVLLLDEPTNDLDVQTLSVLEDFLEDFRGCVVVVSHDRYFLDRTVDRLFNFENGQLKRFEGNYSSFLEQQRRQERELNETNELKSSRLLKDSSPSRISTRSSQEAESLHPKSQKPASKDVEASRNHVN